MGMAESYMMEAITLGNALRTEDTSRAKWYMLTALSRKASGTMIDLSGNEI